MILCGSCGAINHLKMTRITDIDTIKDKVLNEVDIEVKSSDLDSTGQSIVVMKTDSLAQDSTETMVDLKSTIEKYMYMTDYFKRWSVIIGYAGLLVSMIYIVAGIFFFYRKKISILIGFIALGLSIVFSISKILVFAGDSSSELILGTIKYSTFFGVFIDIVLLVILLISDKTYYTEPDWVD
jgi:hypothetical protein